jgi:hypothetical protein
MDNQNPPFNPNQPNQPDNSPVSPTPDQIPTISPQEPILPPVRPDYNPNAESQNQLPPQPPQPVQGPQPQSFSQPPQPGAAPIFDPNQPTANQLPPPQPMQDPSANLYNQAAFQNQPQPPKKTSKLKIILIVLGVIILLFVILAVIGAASLSKTSKNLKCNKGTCSINIGVSNGTGAKSVSTITPYDETATGNGDAAGWKVQISDILNPAVTGQAAKSGYEYLEVNFSVTNDSSKTDFVPGTFYYETSSGKLYDDANTDGSGPNIDHSDAQLATSNLQDLIAVTVTKGQTDTSHYLLYQIPVNDVGHLIWFDGTYQTQTKLATFDLSN